MTKGGGFVALIGAGPGDAGLLTLRGRELLAAAQCVVYDRLVGDGVLAMMPPEAVKINVGKVGGGHFVPQQEINGILVREAQKGRFVVRLKGGDPFVFGRGGEEIEALNESGIAFEVVPGVTSALGGLACAGIPATHRGVARSIHVVTAHTKEGGLAHLDYEALAKLGGTLVFLMGAAAVPEICSELLRAGMPESSPAAALENASVAAQRLIRGTLAELAGRCAAEKLKAPALVVVGGAVGFAEAFAWKKFLPLAGRKVVVTRPRGRGGRLSAMLRARGAEVVELPCISTRRIEAELPEFARYGWLCFTSATGVEALFALLAEEGRDVRSIGAAKIAAIGPATAKALKERGLVTDYMPEVYDGIHLARGLARLVKEKPALMFRAKEGSPELTEELAAQKINFTELPLYETLYEKPEIIPQSADTALFTSASTVRGFKAAMPELKIECACCIGEQTAAEARRAGFKRIITAREATLKSLVKALEEDKR
ncbi:uroporphyrinogen-III C-methyltransferase [Synergistes jonesii]|uniref:uroporphyrinogen-III C-methyltransferase n=1 Tax=Synergistes jonesii TaxID=2754 RepID=UPI0033271B8C